MTDQQQGIPRGCRDCSHLRPTGRGEQAGWRCAVLREFREDCLVRNLKEMHEKQAGTSAAFELWIAPE